MKTPQIIKISISLIILSLLIYFIGPGKLIKTISNINIIYLIPIFIIYIITFLIGAWNVDILLKAIKYNIKFLTLVKYTVISWSMGLISPGKIGDFTIVYFLKKENIESGKGFAVVFIDKLITLLTLFIFAILTALKFLTNKEFLLVLLILSTVVLSILCLLTKKVREFIKAKILKKYSEKFNGFYSTLEFLVKNNKKELFYNFCVTILKWVFSAINISIIFLAFGEKANIIYITLISGSLIIFNLAPLTFHGIGLKETTGIYLYGLLGISPEIILATYLIFNTLAYSVAALAIYLLTNEIGNKPILN